MNNPVMILYLEDNPRDAELVRDKLQQIGMACELRVAINRSEYEAALAQTRFDLILSDYCLPDYDGMAALALARAKQPDVPFILISGTLGEEQAVDCVLRGATDFVLKQRLNRLVPGVVRALTLTEEHQKYREAEVALRESEEQFRVMFEMASVGMAQADPRTGQWSRVNQKMCMITGYSADELLKMRIAEITHPLDRQKDWEPFQRVVRGEAPDYHLEKRYVRKDGTEIWVNVNMTIIFDATGQPTRTMATIEDITERKWAEEEIKRNSEIENAMNALLKLTIEINNEKEFLEGALDLLLSLNWLKLESKGAIFLADDSKKTLHLQVHRGFSGELLAACSTVPFGKCLCGRAAAERTIQFADCIDWKHEIRIEGMSPHGHYCVPILSGNNVLGVINLYVKEGYIRDLRETEFLMAVANVFATVIVRNRLETEREKMETQLGQLQKMEAIGQLAGGVAHDFNNMLSVINGYSELILVELSQSDPNYSRIQEINKVGQRSADLTKQLLAFARKQTIDPKVLDMNDTVSGMVGMLRRLIGENIGLLWEPAANIWKVKIDPSQINQILANLIVNARDSISGNGKIIIETGKADLDEAFCKERPDSAPGQYVVLSVSDTGSGMGKETIEHIFEPFFTTKKIGEGTGLGLATIFGIVKQNNGFINVYSEPGKGTTFKIYLPRTEALETEERPKAGKMLTGIETVLLVEDEESLLRIAKIQLGSLGYKVLAAGSPEQAISIAGEYKGEIHLLMTDVVMPEMSGRVLRDRITSTRPGIKCLFMSGYTADVIANNGVLEAGINFLEKPFTVEDLSVKLRKALV